MNLVELLDKAILPGESDGFTKEASANSGSVNFDREYFLKIASEINTEEKKADFIEKVADVFTRMNEENKSLTNQLDHVVMEKNASSLIDEMISKGHINPEDRNEKIANLVKESSNDEISEMSKAAKILEKVAGPIGEEISGSDADQSPYGKLLNKLLMK